MSEFNGGIMEVGRSRQGGGDGIRNEELVDDLLTTQLILSGFVPVGTVFVDVCWLYLHCME